MKWEPAPSPTDVTPSRNHFAAFLDQFNRVLELFIQQILVGGFQQARDRHIIGLRRLA